jgi:hypothetical protein
LRILMPGRCLGEMVKLEVWAPLGYQDKLAALIARHRKIFSVVPMRERISSHANFRILHCACSVQR